MSTENEGQNDNKIDERKFFIRQVFVASVAWTYYFMFGLSVGAPTVIIPQIRPQVNTSFAISGDMESWLFSTMGFAGLFWIPILTALTYVIGRKHSSLLVSVTSLMGFTLFYCSSSVTHLLIYQIIQGPLAASQTSVSFMISSEYTSPHYRGMFITAQVASVFWGIWVSNAIGTFTHWKYIGLFGIFCSLYTTINSIISPESPFWLSIRGRLQECAKSHRWLKGNSMISEQELADFLKFNKDKISSRTMMSSIKQHANNFFTVIRLPEVYKSLGFSVLCMTMYHYCGKFVCTMYSLDIIKKITGNTHAAYVGMLLMDGVTVVGMYCGCILPKHFKRRSLCITTCSFAVTFIFAIFIYLYLIELGVIIENVYVTITLFMCFSLAVSIGPMSVSSVLLGDFLPLKSRSICICILSFYGKAVFSINLKIFPSISKAFNIYGTFLIFGIISLIILILSYTLLPETKNKTVIEIAEILRGINKPKDNESKELMLIKVYDDVNSANDKS